MTILPHDFHLWWVEEYGHPPSNPTEADAMQLCLSAYKRALQAAQSICLEYADSVEIDLPKSKEAIAATECAALIQTLANRV